MNPKLVYYVIRLLEGMGMGSFFPIYTPWLKDHGLNFFKMGVVNFFYHISSSALDPFTGFFADKFGKRKAFILGQLFWTTTQFIYGASSQIGGFLLAEGIAAIGNSMKSDALESWLQNRLGKAESSRVMGKAAVLFNLGQIVTSILAGYISVNLGADIAWFVSGGLFLAATILGSIALISAGDDLPNIAEKDDEKSELNFKQIVSLAFSNKKIVSSLLLIAAANFTYKPVFMYWAQILEILGMPKATLGFTILAVSIPTTLGGLLAGQNKFLTQNIVGIGRIFGLLVIGLLIASVAKSLSMFFVGLIILEVAYGATGIIMYGYLYDEIHPKHRSTINSIVSSARTFGGAISLLLMGALADLYTPQATLLLGAILLLLTRPYYLKTKS